MKLVKIEEDSYYFEDYITTGFIKISDETAVLVDSGMDKSYGKKVAKELEGLGVKNVHIINTHSHADHYGGNSYIVSKFKTEIYATKLEKAIIENPILEPIYLGYGAFPIKELQSKFLMGEESIVNHTLSYLSGAIGVENSLIGILPLPGHSFEQIGVHTGKTLYFGDCILSKETLEKHKIPFLTDIKSYLETLDYLRKTTFKYYVGAHLGMVQKDELDMLIGAHENKVSEINQKIIELVRNIKLISLTDLIKNILEFYSINIQTIPQYYLMQSTLVSFINYLHSKGEIELKIVDNVLSIAITSELTN